MLPATVWDWPELLTELGRRETASVLIAGSDELASSLLGRRLVDRVVASSRTHVPRGFSTRQPPIGADSQVVAYREDGER
jgi:riboflavin biosynthesis pyrimidine reductase